MLKKQFLIYLLSSCLIYQNYVFAACTSSDPVVKEKKTACLADQATSGKRQDNNICDCVFTDGARNVKDQFRKCNEMEELKDQNSCREGLAIQASGLESVTDESAKDFFDGL